MIFATDLDSTMIFSHRLVENLNDNLSSSVHCVEIYNDRSITYMTTTAIERLKFLMDRIHVIPVTTRSIAQLNRVKIFMNTEYAIADNGGVILHNGVIDSKWEKHIHNILDMYDLGMVLDIFYQLPDLTLKPKVVDNCFVFTKTDNVELCKQVLKNKLDTKMWQLSFQGKKVYAIPQGITKGLALQHICQNLISNSSPVIASGDSNLDLSMLQYADYGIIPADCCLAELKEANEFIKVGTGIYSAEEILGFVMGKLG